jgi:hypothetical protein
MKARSVFKIIALVGVPVTAYLANMGKDIKAKRLKEQGVPVSKKEKAVDHIVSYWPAYLSGAVTMASIIASDTLAGKEIAAATALATAAAAKKDVLKGQFEKYRGAVKETDGDEKDISYMQKASEIRLNDEGEVLRHFKLKWCDGKNIEFDLSMADAQEAINKINRELYDATIGSGVVTVSDCLGYFKHPELADKDTGKAGWSAELLWVECDCYWLDFYIYPEGESIFAHGDESTDAFIIDVVWPPEVNIAKAIEAAGKKGVI